MDKVVFNNGRTFNDSSISEPGWTNNTILCIIKNATMQQIASLISDPKNYEKIVYYGNIKKVTYTGLTTIDTITQSDNSIEIWLSGKNRINANTEYTVPKEYLPEGMR